MRSLGCILLLAVACDGGADGESRPDASVDAGREGQEDADGDFLTNAQEGASENIDTDADGLPDYLDDDSDGDGVPDRLEAGDINLNTAPTDVDGDGVPDFRDTDADGNGLRDGTDGTGDLDEDGIADFRDRDDDGDLVLDATEIGNPRTPRDTDGDLVLDHQDSDSDNDFILDRDEGDVDTDRDGTADRIDLDSDGDGFSDEAEAGDRDRATAPVDTDLDGTPDFRDPDSDDDGLADSQEFVAGTSPTDPDSDDDDVSDLIEVGAGTDARNPGDNPRSRGDFVFLVPFEEGPSPTEDTLAFKTSIQKVDLYFGFDTTASMGVEMDTMRNPTLGVPGIIDALRCSVSQRACTDSDGCNVGEICNDDRRCQEDPRETSCIPDIWTGVGTFTELDSYRNRVSLQADPVVTAEAIPTTGAGIYEAIQQVPACVANGSNCMTPAGVFCSVDPTRLGCPGFRADAVRIYVQITDANEQCKRSGAEPDRDARCDMFDASFAGLELRRAGIRFIGLVGNDDLNGTGTPRGIAEAIGRASNTLDAGGDPLVLDAQDAAVVAEAEAAVRTFVDNEFEVRIFAENTVGNAVQFIDYLEVKQTAGDERCPTLLEDGTTPIVAADTDPDFLEPSGRPDTRPDYFPVLDPGVPVCWDVVPLQNDTVEPTRDPQLFLARLQVRVAGSVVDSRDVYFLIPPVIADPGEPI